MCRDGWELICVYKALKKEKAPPSGQSWCLKRLLTLSSRFAVDCVLLFNFACFYFQGPFGPVGQKGEVSYATGLIYWCFYLNCCSSDQIRRWL